MEIHWQKVKYYFYSKRVYFSVLVFVLIYFHNEGLVVSTCLAGAFLGSFVSGWIADGVGRRGAFQLCAVPILAGSSLW